MPNSIVFAVIGTAGLGLTQLIMYLGVELMKIHYMYAKIIAVAAVFAWNFGLRRVLLFRRKGPSWRTDSSS